MDGVFPSPIPLSDLANGAWTFKTVVAGLELGLFEQMSVHGGFTISEYAGSCALAERPAEALLTACASLELLVKVGDRYQNTAVAEESALMSLNMLVETTGRNYTLAEYTSWLIETGFVDWQCIPIESPGANAVIIANKP